MFMSSDTFSVTAVADASHIDTSQQALTFFSLDVLLNYFRNIAESSAFAAGGKFSANFVQSSGIVASLVINITTDSSSGMTAYQIAISNGAATLTVLALSELTATAGPAKALLDAAIYKIIHDNLAEIMADPAGWAERAKENAIAVAEEIDSMVNSDDMPSLSWSITDGNDNAMEHDRTDDADNAYNTATAATAPARVDPLILDLDGDGIETTAVNRYGAHFDLDANGFAESVGWVSSDDGILVRDLNGDGVINDGAELFGDHTLLKNGETAASAWYYPRAFETPQNPYFR